jgi:hypothetical protein
MGTSEESALKELQNLFKIELQTIQRDEIFQIY